MTSLDNLLSLINSKCDPIAAIQVTPQKILLSVTMDGFWQCLEVVGKEKLQFRFLERIDQKLDVHLLLEASPFPLEITLSIIDHTSNFNKRLFETYPSAMIYF
ncbi:MAG: hypothetical protein ACXAC8_18640 [Candidatus Hodarchaeales archaeon]|jgi:hypothetical protein